MDPERYRFAGFNKETLNGIARAAKKGLKGYTFSTFLAGCSFQRYLSEEGKALLKKEFQPLLVKGLEKSLKAKADFENPEMEILVNFNQDLVFFFPKPVYLKGRYNKLSRKITQTRHYCYECKGRGCPHCGNKGILTRHSVQSLVEKHALKRFKCKEAKFHGAGREDKDVRMLGPGRKFVLELVEPKKRKASLKKLQAEINKAEKGKIRVKGLEYAEKSEIAEIKGEKSEKIYEAMVQCEKKPEAKGLKALKGKKLKVKQRTPSRVEKRRADKVRERNAEILKAASRGKSIKLKIKAMSGLYIKEFVSGDSGRTKPSLSELLGQKCECKGLDVLKILD